MNALMSWRRSAGAGSWRHIIEIAFAVCFVRLTARLMARRSTGAGTGGAVGR